MVRGLIFGFFNLTRYKSVFAILRGGLRISGNPGTLGIFCVSTVESSAECIGGQGAGGVPPLCLELWKRTHKFWAAYCCSPPPPVGQPHAHLWPCVRRQARLLGNLFLPVAIAVRSSNGPSCCY